MRSSIGWMSAVGALAAAGGAGKARVTETTGNNPPSTLIS